MMPGDIQLPSSNNLWDRTALEVALFTMMREALTDIEYGLKHHSHARLEMAAHLMRDIINRHKDKFKL